MNRFVLIGAASAAAFGLTATVAVGQSGSSTWGEESVTGGAVIVGKFARTPVEEAAADGRLAATSTPELKREPDKTRAVESATARPEPRTSETPTPALGPQLEPRPTIATPKPEPTLAPFPAITKEAPTPRPSEAPTKPVANITPVKPRDAEPVTNAKPSGAR